MGTAMSLARRLTSAFVVVTVAGAVALAVRAATGVAAPGDAASAYTWRNVRIDGGGFVPGIVFSRTEPGLIYARTDIGGAYRWDETGKRWIPLLDHVGWDNWGHLGVLSIAADARDPDRVYAAVGMYTNDWDPHNGAILRSADRGANWQAFDLPFKVGGNMPGRGQGERLAVDPNHNAIVYFGAEGGNGLWRSTDHGVTFSQVDSFPNPGDHAQDPTDASGYLSQNQGVLWVTFDESSGSAGSVGSAGQPGTAGEPTQVIYVGVADKDSSIYRSLDGGVSWEPVPGQPTGYLPHKGVYDAASDTLYLATSDTGGPYDGGKGQVWKYRAGTGEWTDISPVPLSAGDDLHFGYSGLTVDRQDPDTIMVATQVSWWPDVVFFRSTDAGATWTRAWDYTTYPERANRYTMDISSVPWLTMGATPAAPEQAPKLGWMTESVEIDPFDSDRFLYGTGATVYGAADLTKWDSGGTVTIRPMVTGLEETAVLDLISPPSGAPLISALGDIGGFRHDDLDAVPPMMFTNPIFTTTTSLDYAGRRPEVVVRAGDFTDADRPADAHVAFSTDGGATWTQAGEPDGVNRGGTVAAGADGDRFVWAPGDAGQPVVFTEDLGRTWTPAEGVPAGARVEADRVDPSRFYAYAAGRFHRSDDGGRSFVATGAVGLPTQNVKFTTAPDTAGDIWLAGDTGLFRSVDGGDSFTRVDAVTDARNVALGKAAPQGPYHAVYIAGTIDGVTGVHRSDDAGASWVRVDDDRHRYGNAGEALAADPRVYGRVYLGTNGRGALYADLAG